MFPSTTMPPLVTLTNRGHVRLLMAVLKICSSFYKRHGKAKVSARLMAPENPATFNPACRTTNWNTILLEMCNGLPVRAFGRCGYVTLFDEAVLRGLATAVDEAVTVPLWEHMELFPVTGSGGTLVQVTEIGSESIGLPRLEGASELLECSPAQEHCEINTLWHTEMERLVIQHGLFDVPLRKCLSAMAAYREAKLYAQAFDVAYLSLQAKGITDTDVLYTAANACIFGDAQEYMPIFYPLMWHEMVIFSRNYTE